MLQVMNIRTLYAYLLRVVIPPFVISFILFTFFVETLDVLINLIRYLYEDISIINILKIQWLYLPTSLSYALPVAILFSVTFSMGQLCSHNELIAVFVSGISLLKFVIPLILLGALLSVGNFYFKEHVVIETFRTKNELTRVYLNQSISQSNSQVAILQEGGDVVYYAELYDDDEKKLYQPIIIITDENNKLELRIDAKEAIWKDSQWEFQNANLYTYNPEKEKYTVTTRNTYTNAKINTSPTNFKRIISNVDEMPFYDALAYIEQLKDSGYPYQKLLTDTYSRIPLSLSPFVIMIVACLSGSVFRKNTMLMSLLNALISAVVYYSVDLMGSILAARNILDPLLGAWIGFFTTLTLSICVYKFLVK